MICREDEDASTEEKTYLARGTVCFVLAHFNGVIALGSTVGVFSTARHDGVE